MRVSSTRAASGVHAEIRKALYKMERRPYISALFTAQYSREGSRSRCRLTLEVESSTAPQALQLRAPISSPDVVGSLKADAPCPYLVHGGHKLLEEQVYIANV